MNAGVSCGAGVWVRGEVYRGLPCWQVVVTLSTYNTGWGEEYMFELRVSIF